jgi:hypothetical protein
MFATSSLLIAAIHLATIYVGVYVLQLNYPMFLALLTATSVISGLLTAKLSVEVKARAERELRSGSPSTDLMAAAVVMIAAATASNLLIVRRYGILGWLGVLAASVATHAVVGTN